MDSVARQDGSVSSVGSTKGLVAELGLVCLLVGYGEFSIYRLILLLLLASQSLWVRRLSWSHVGLRRPTSVSRTVLQAFVAASIILVAVGFLIVPGAVWLTGVPVDLSALGEPRDVRALWLWLGQAWTLAAFGEEMVFRGYLIRRLSDLTGDGPIGRAIALVISSALFGLAHRYQGWAGVIATGTIGGILGLFYFVSRRNLWAVILCHALVDTVALSAIYFDRRSWLFP
ncbi:MAG: CPBP family intramembrane metalloprotease [Luteitalea sp.]|nr:CPBP family intramembrane metalloprotease [Luteitalea sp.]